VSMKLKYLIIKVLAVLIVAVLVYFAISLGVMIYRLINLMSDYFERILTDGGMGSVLWLGKVRCGAAWQGLAWHDNGIMFSESQQSL